ncbi:MAG: tRNA-dihydrouridine synthase [Phycisphaerales bacterium]|nr:MAG: tRNA-dihydrouridine synthase [Phycisphaerales bacterium]
MRRGHGGALLNKPDSAIDILKAVRDAVTCPVLMKLRIGVNRKPALLSMVEARSRVELEAAINTRYARTSLKGLL